MAPLSAAPPAPSASEAAAPLLPPPVLAPTLVIQRSASHGGAGIVAPSGAGIVARSRLRLASAAERSRWSEARREDACFLTRRLSSAPASHASRSTAAVSLAALASSRGSDTSMGFCKV